MLFNKNLKIFLFTLILIFSNILFFHYAANAAGEETATTLLDDTGSNEANVIAPKQDNERLIRRLMIEGSFSNAGFDGTHGNFYSKQNSYTIGMLTDLLGEKKWVLETGVLFRQSNTLIDNGITNNVYSANYISIPLSAKYYLSGQVGTSFYVKAGAMESNLISNDNVYASDNTLNKTRSWETALLAGIGAKINLSPATDILIEINYNRALESMLVNSSVYRSDINAALGLALNL